MIPALVDGRSVRLPKREGRELKPVESELRKNIPRGSGLVVGVVSFFAANFHLSKIFLVNFMFVF